MEVRGGRRRGKGRGKGGGYRGRQGKGRGEEGEKRTIPALFPIHLAAWRSG